MKILVRILFVIVVLLIIAVSVLISRNNRLNVLYNISASNEKAFMAENDTLKNKNRVFQFTIEQLEYTKDSLIVRMDSMRKVLSIKDKNLKQMQFLLSESRKRDTIVFRDTLFIDPNLDIDTVLEDKWYSLYVRLTFPDRIIAEPVFTSERYIFTSYRKETVKPPKKCFIGRLFQRKHEIMEVEVIDNNPYIKNKKQKFIEILK